MRSIKRFFVVQPISTPGVSATTYVPAVMASRGLGFIRMLLVGRLLGKQDFQFGLYTLALYLINVLVALVLFGAADVAERYVSRVEKIDGHAGVRKWLRRQYARLGLSGVAAVVLLSLLSPWISRAVWGEQEKSLMIACGVTVLLLALYQHLAAVLRGVRAYAASAGMELLSGCLLLVFSGIAAISKNAFWLMIAYALSVLLPLIVFGFLLRKYLHQPEPAAEKISDEKNAGEKSPATRRFAAWSLVRLMLVMAFGFLAPWGVRVIDEHFAGSPAQQAVSATGQFSTPFVIAQMIGFLAVALWASSYGIAARAWSHGQIRRATVEFFRIGRFGMAALCIIAVLVMWMRGIFAWMLPQYAGAIMNLLPGLLAMFIGYALVAFFSSLADLRESPQRGAALWGTAVLVQILGILAGRFGALSFTGLDAKTWMVVVSALGVAAALVIPAPLLLCRPLKFSATGVPLFILGACAVTFFSPSWVVDWIAGPVMIGAVLLLFSMKLMVRPMDRRAYRRWGRRALTRRARGGILGAFPEATRSNA